MKQATLLILVLRITIILGISSNACTPDYSACFISSTELAQETVKQQLGYLLYEKFDLPYYYYSSEAIETTERFQAYEGIMFSLITEISSGDHPTGGGGTTLFVFETPEDAAIAYLDNVRTLSEPVSVPASIGDEAAVSFRQNPYIAHLHDIEIVFRRENIVIFTGLYSIDFDQEAGIQYMRNLDNRIIELLCLD